VKFATEEVSIERIGTDGDIAVLKRLFREMDGKVDAFGIGGVDLYVRLVKKEYPLYAALDLVKEVTRTPVLDGRGLKHTLERRVFELAREATGELPHFRQAFIPLALDRIGLAEAAGAVSDRLLLGDLMIALGIPILLRGLPTYRRVARLLMPLVSRFPISMMFYGSGGAEAKPKYLPVWQQSDLLAGDFMFMRKYLPEDLAGKTVVTNTTTGENLELLHSRGVRQVITTTPRYEGRSFGTNMLEAALTAYAGKGRALTDPELNTLIDELQLRPSVINF
jgi:hypothetical protein